MLDRILKQLGLSRDLSRAPGPQALPPDAPQGVSGTAVVGGYVQVVERRPELAGDQRYVTFSNALANTAIVSAGVRYFLNLVSRPQWTLDPTDHPDSQRLTDLVYAMMYGPTAGATSWQRVVRRAAMYRFYGFSLQEWTAGVRADGTIGMADVAVRPQSTIRQWDVDERGRVYGAWQESPMSGARVFLPRWKLVYLVDDSVSDSPEGMGLFRHVAESVRRLNRYEQLEGWGYETDLRGIPVGRAPIAEMRENKADVDAELQGMRAFLRGHVKTPNMSVLLDSMTYEDRETRRPSSAYKWGLDLLRSDANSHAEVLRAIERLNREIARVLGVEQLLLGDGAAGSFALAKEKNHNFAVQVDGTLEELREAFQRDYLGPIWAMNGWPLEAMPEMLTDRLQYRSAQEVADTLAKMGQAGAMTLPNDPAVNQVRDLLGLQHPVEVPSALDAGLLPGRQAAEVAEMAAETAEATAEATPEDEEASA